MSDINEDILRAAVAATSQLKDPKERRRAIRFDLSTRGFSKPDIVAADSAIRDAISNGSFVQGKSSNEPSEPKGNDSGSALKNSSLPARDVPADVLERIAASAQGNTPMRRRRQIKTALKSEGYSDAAIENVDASIMEFAGLKLTFQDAQSESDSETSPGRAGGEKATRKTTNNPDVRPVDQPDDTVRLRTEAEIKNESRVAHKPEFWDSGQAIITSTERKTTRVGSFATFVFPLALAACAFAVFGMDTSLHDISKIVTGDTPDRASAAVEPEAAASKSSRPSPEFLADGAEFERIYDSLNALKITTANCARVEEIPLGGSRADFEYFDAGLKSWRSCLNSALAEVEHERARIELLVVKMTALFERHHHKLDTELASDIRIGISEVTKRLQSNISKARQIHVQDKGKWAEVLDRRNAEIERISNENRARAEQARAQRKREKIEQYNRNLIASGRVPERSNAHDSFASTQSDFSTPPTSFEQSSANQPIYVPGIGAQTNDTDFRLTMTAACPIGHVRLSGGECQNRAVSRAERLAFEAEQRARAARDQAIFDRMEAERAAKISGMPNYRASPNTSCGNSCVSVK